MTRFMQFGAVAAQEAIDDSGWTATSSQAEERAGVCLGSGIGSLHETYEAVLALERSVSIRWCVVIG